MPRSNARRRIARLFVQREVVAEVLPQPERDRRQAQAAAPAAAVRHRLVALARGHVQRGAELGVVGHRPIIPPRQRRARRAMPCRPRSSRGVRRPEPATLVARRAPAEPPRSVVPAGRGSVAHEHLRRTARERHADDVVLPAREVAAGCGEHRRAVARDARSDETASRPCCSRLSMCTAPVQRVDALAVDRVLAAELGEQLRARCADHASGVGPDSRNGALTASAGERREPSGFIVQTLLFGSSSRLCAARSKVRAKAIFVGPQTGFVLRWFERDPLRRAAGDRRPCRCRCAADNVFSRSAARAYASSSSQARSSRPGSCPSRSRASLCVATSISTSVFAFAGGSPSAVAIVFESGDQAVCAMFALAASTSIGPPAVGTSSSAAIAFGRQRLEKHRAAVRRDQRLQADAPARRADAAPRRCLRRPRSTAPFIGVLLERDRRAGRRGQQPARRRKPSARTSALAATVARPACLPVTIPRSCERSIFEPRGAAAACAQRSVSSRCSAA